MIDLRREVLRVFTPPVFFNEQTLSLHPSGQLRAELLAFPNVKATARERYQELGAEKEWFAPSLLAGLVYREVALAACEAIRTLKITLPPVDLERARQLAIQAVKKIPSLTANGVNDRQAPRDGLDYFLSPSGLDMVARSAQWIEWIGLADQLVHQRSSYGYKHDVERGHPCTTAVPDYVANGAFIAAFVGLGGKYRVEDYGPNVLCALNRRRLKAAEKLDRIMQEREEPFPMAAPRWWTRHCAHPVVYVRRECDFEADAGLKRDPTADSDLDLLDP